jgi:phage terminase Nu1 subunit (DNA packaging protein)
MTTIAKFFTARELSKWIGIGLPRIRELTALGVLKKGTKGYAMPETNLAYTAYLRQGKIGKRGVGKASGSADEKQRLTRLQADALELKNRAASGKMLDEDVVKERVATVNRNVRNGVLAAPARVAQTMPHWTQRDVAAIDAELRRVLTALGTAAD